MSAKVRFLLNGLEEVAVSPAPDLTILQWLRTERRLTGTKEGCAEGDCGACTIAIADVRNGELAWSAANACIMMMGQLHGRLLVTVEGIADGQALHPVQAAMVAHHASQCGYCTPGFVMSLFAAFRNGESGETADVHDAIAGNLCRCTGYRPIVAAAQDALAQARIDRFSDMAPQIAERLRAIARGSLARLRHAGGQVPRAAFARRAGRSPAQRIRTRAFSRAERISASTSPSGASASPRSSRSTRSAN